LANECLVFDAPVAAKIAATIDYSNKALANDIEVISGLKEKNDKLTTLSEEFKSKAEFLEKDKVILKTRGDGFEDAYTKTVAELVKSEQSKPSRLVWFGSGVVTTLILGVVSIFLIKK
jgi:hypothetical protein